MESWSKGRQLRDDIIIREEIIRLLDERVQPSVEMHGGVVQLKDFSDGIATIFMSGACSGCSSSSLTLHMGIEQLLKHYIPEVKSVIGEEDPNSTVDPYYT